MLERIVCEGAPRDLGLDQGRACRDAIREVAARAGWIDSWRRAVAPPRPFARELRRHFPHLAERVEGLARGAEVGFAALVEALERGLSEPERGALDLTCAEGAVLRARLAGTERGIRALALRESRPEVGYRSLALVRPCGVASLAGVNEAGLAMGWCAAGRRSRHAASAAWLGEQCLERFERVPNALEWCERRPGRGSLRLLFTDAAGGVGALEIADDACRRIDPDTLRDVTPPGAPGIWVRLDPVSRSLAVAEKPHEAGTVFSL